MTFTGEAMTDDELMKMKRKAASDPLRQKMLERLARDRDWTVKELADDLGVGANGLYYHLRILEQAEFAAVSGARLVGRSSERTYRGNRVFEQIVTWDFSDPFEVSAHFAALLEVAKEEVDDCLFRGAQDMEAGERATFAMVEAPAFATTRDDIRAFTRDLRELQMKYRRRARAAAKKLGGVPDDWRYMKVTYAVRERPLTESLD